MSIWIDVGRKDVRLGWAIDLPTPPPSGPCNHDGCHRARIADGLCNIHWWPLHGGTATTRNRYRPVMTAADAALRLALAIIASAPVGQAVPVNPALQGVNQHTRRYVRQFLAVTNGTGAKTSGTPRTMTITVTDPATALAALQRWYADFVEGADASMG